MDVVRPQSGTIRLGADCGRTAGLGLSGVERGPTEGSWMVHPQVAYAVAGGRRCPDIAVVDSSRRTSGAILVDDRKIPGAAGVAGMGCGFGGAGAPVRGRGITRLSARARKSAERGKHVLIASSTLDDDGGLGPHFVECLAQTNPLVARTDRAAGNETAGKTIPLLGTKKITYIPFLQCVQRTLYAISLA